MPGGSTGFDASGTPAVFFKLPCLKLFDHDKIMTERQQVSLYRDNYLLSWPDLFFCIFCILEEERMAALQAGEMAPEIELPAVTGKQRHKFKLSDLRGKKNVIVAFYPLDWSPT